MPPNRPLRGSCHCGRNVYIVQFPSNPDPTQVARVVFDTHPTHRTILGTPLPAYLRVPLAWYTSEIIPRHPDETRAQIRRVYQLHSDDDFEDNDDQGKKKNDSNNNNNNKPFHIRHFCGFCGTPLSYWRAHPPQGEGEFIQLALGSIVPSDLRELEEEFGVVVMPQGLSDSPSSRAASPVSARSAGVGSGQQAATGEKKQEEEEEEEGYLGLVGGLPWFDELVEGSRLGRGLRRTMMTTTRSWSTEGWGTGTGRVRVAWEVTEWTEEGSGCGESPRKRKFDDRGGVGGEMMEGL
ncbi:hypothetical protein VTJ04DRAFT_320 [Mycothermus thermophilus]|uniref:uncharacterized protein n=1 Tax=Humicola insolens TaxID=85995 RepID=UPI003742162B